MKALLLTLGFLVVAYFGITQYKERQALQRKAEETEELLRMERDSQSDASRAERAKKERELQAQNQRLSVASDAAMFKQRLSSTFYAIKEVETNPDQLISETPAFNSARTEVESSQASPHQARATEFCKVAQQIITMTRDYQSKLSTAKPPVNEPHIVNRDRELRRERDAFFDAQTKKRWTTAVQPYVRNAEAIWQTMQGEGSAR